MINAVLVVVIAMVIITTMSKGKVKYDYYELRKVVYMLKLFKNNT